MQIRKLDPPKVVERAVAVEFTREEVISLLFQHIKFKLNAYPLRMEDIEVRGDPDGKLTALEMSGVEIIPINWKSEQKNDESIPG